MNDWENSPTIRMIGTRRMQCKDIPDEIFLDAVVRTRAVDGSFEPHRWRMRWLVQETLEKILGPIPENLMLAKARKLIFANKLGGCECGCRGDYHIPCQYEFCCVLPKEQ